MRLLEVKIENFRSLKSTSLTFNGLTGIMGGVSVGKSNLLLSLELFWNSELLAQEQDTERLKKDLYEETIARIPDPGVLDNVLNTGSLFASFTFQITGSEDLDIFQSANGQIRDYIQEYEPKIILVELELNSQKNIIRRKLGLSNNLNKSNIFWLKLPQSEIQTWHEVIGRSFFILLKDEYLLTLEEDIGVLLSDHYVKNLFERYLTEVLGEECEFLIVENEKGNYPGLIYLARESNLLPLRYLSKGTKRLLLILSYLVDPKFRQNSSILVIDDPEIYLQAREQRALADLFVDNVSKNQIIFSTASLRFLVGDLYLASLTNNITSLKRISAKDDNDVELLVKSLGIRPSDSLSADTVIFLEGYIDKAVLETFFEITQSYLTNDEANFSGFYYSKRVPRISFIPIDGWTKMSFVISVRILKEKFVRSSAFALVDGDTYEQDPNLFTKIQSSFERVFGEKTFFKLNESCIESILLNNPKAISRAFKINEFKLQKRIEKLKNKYSDKEAMKRIYLEFGKNKFREDVYNSTIAKAIAKQFSYEEIPSKIIHIFRKITWLMSEK